MIYIYALVDPRDGRMRYIGKTTNPVKRFREHCNDKNAKLHRVCWIQSLKRQNLLPVMDILSELSDEANWQKEEMTWISCARDAGCDLTNGTDGGDGLTNITPEIKDKRRLKLIGVKHTEERKNNISISRKLCLQDPVVRQRLVDAVNNRKLSAWDLEQSAQKRRSLSIDDVFAIKDLISQGLNAKDIANKFGVPRYTIQDIKRGKNYKNVVVGACSTLAWDFISCKLIQYSPSSQMIVPEWLTSKV
jgi:GIY-YIG catalytic domain